MGGKVVTLLDTSVINHIFDDPQQSLLVERLHRTRKVYVPFVAIDEICATPSAERRAALYSFAIQIVETEGNSLLLPDNEILRDLIAQFDTTRAVYPLNSLKALVDVRGSLSVDEVRRDSNLSDKARTGNRERRKQFEERLKAIAARFRSAFPHLEAEAPERTLTALKQGGHFRALARDLYSAVAIQEVSNEALDFFIEHCPPFNCLLTTICIAQHERFVSNVKRAAGPNDLFQSVYAPYCDEVIVRDKAFQNALMVATHLCGIPTKVQAFEELREDLLC
jgi:hypothetical protein